MVGLELPFVTAAVTDKLVEFATNVIGDLGYAGVFVLMTLESALIPIPSEATMLFAGYYGRLELVERHRIFHANRRYLDWADDWFNRHGDATVFFSRMVPVIRTFISLPAGVARMPFWRFSVLTLLGCIPWVFGLGFLGKLAGSKWDDWKDRLHYLDYLVLAAIVALIVYAIWKRRRNRARSAADAEEQPAS